MSPLSQHRRMPIVVKASIILFARGGAAAGGGMHVAAAYGVKNDQ